MLISNSLQETTMFLENTKRSTLGICNKQYFCSCTVLPPKAADHLVEGMVIAKWTVRYSIFIDSSVKLSALLSLIAFDQQKKNMNS